MKRDTPGNYRRTTGRAMANGTCSVCGKLSFPTRKDAKLFAKQHHQGEHISQYRCTSMFGEVWHNGHPPKGIVSGRAIWHVEEIHAKDVKKSVEAVKKSESDSSTICDGCWATIPDGMVHRCEGEDI